MNYIFCIIFVLLGLSARLIPHAPNFTPILSIALLSGFYIKNKYIVFIPILIMLLSDIFIGYYSLVPWIYCTLILIYLIGTYLMKDNFLDILLKSLVSAFLFFIITNFGVWTTGFYGYTFEGILTCYTVAIPFFKNTITSVVLFSSLIYSINKAINLFTINRVKA